MADSESEVVRLLRDLLRFDTTNPPGNETPCAEFLHGMFRAEGFDSVVVESAPGRGNVVARLKGGSEPPLLLCAHLDVVPASGKWTHPPFAAEVHDGYIWGRGAIDMKHMAAMCVVIMLELKRRGVKLKRDVIFAGVADEEAGGAYGAGWLVDHRPELIRAEYCLCEVGGIATPMGGKILVPVQTAQKGYVWFKLRARGQGGHGSRPGVAADGSAVVALAKAVAKLSAKPLTYRLTATTRAFLDTVATLQTGAGKAAMAALKNGQTAAFALKLLPQERRKTFHAMLFDTVAVTGLVAGAKVNVIPPDAEATVDGRFLPGGTKEQFVAQVQALVGQDIEVDVFDSAPPLEIDHRGPLWDSIVKVMTRELPGCTVAANMITGMTDAKDFDRLGIKTYGFSPVLLKEGEDFAELYHAPDERVSIAGLEAGLTWLRGVVEDFCL